MFLGIEIGGTKLQLGLGRGDGILTSVWRGVVNPAEGGEGIRKQIVAAIPELLATASAVKSDLQGIGIGFGGPTDDPTQTVVKSHHIVGWDSFPLRDWISNLCGVPAVLCNDADVAGLAEARFGAGKGLSPIFYITVGTGVGGSLIIDGQIYRGAGRGAAEIGHLRPVYPLSPTHGHDGILEDYAAGSGIAKVPEQMEQRGADISGIRHFARGGPFNGKVIADAARAGDPVSLRILDEAVQALAEGICSVIKLLCPRRIIIGGGLSLIGEELWFKPLRKYVADRGMAALAGLTEIVPAALGEEVVVHGALALACQMLGA